MLAGRHHLAHDGMPGQLADAQTSGGLLVVGELPGHPVVGEVVAAGEHAVVVR